MIISVPIETELVSTSPNVIDTTPEYDKNTQAYYQNNQDLKDGGFIYRYSNESFTPANYDSSDEQTYAIDNVLFKDGETVKVSSIGDRTVLRQPEEYAAGFDTTFTYSTWKKAWSKVQTGISIGPYYGFLKTVNGITHQLYRDITSSTGWTHKFSYPVTETYWSEDYYSYTADNRTGSYYYMTWHHTTKQVRIIFDMHTIYNAVYTGALVDLHDTVFVAEDGNSYKFSTKMVISRDQAGNVVSYYAFKKLLTRTVTVTKKTEARYYTSLDSSSVIENAYCYDGTDCDNKWLGKTFVQRGTDLYVKTQIGEIENKTVNVPQYTAIDDLSAFPSFSLVGVINELKPFDEKHYTVAKAYNSMTYEVKGLSKFDTLAIGHIKADNIVINFKDQYGNIKSTLAKPIDGSRDEFGYLEKWHTTVIYYSEDVLEENSTVEIIMTGSEIELGTLMLGMSVNAGFTNLNLTNSFIDHSVYREDEWGNIDYVERAKISVYRGSVDINITDYDRTDRLLTSIGGKVVIVNGSDSKNEDSDSKTIFSSTQKIGRLFDLEQQNKVSYNDIEKMANYTFTLKEIV